MQTDKRRSHKSVYVISLSLAVTILSGCNLTVKSRLSKTDPSEAVSTIEHHLDYYSGHLHIGMPKGDALAILPMPHNTNTENVCVWVLPSTETNPQPDHQDWQWLQSTRGGYFVIFVDGKLATPLCANAAFDPWQALEHYSHLTSAEIQKILGPKS